MNKAVFAVMRSKTNNSTLVVIIIIVNELPKKACQHLSGLSELIFLLYPDRTRNFRFNRIIFGKLNQLEIRVCFGITIDRLDVRHSDFRISKLFYFNFANYFIVKTQQK